MSPKSNFFFYRNSKNNFVLGTGQDDDNSEERAGEDHGWAKNNKIFFTIRNNYFVELIIIFTERIAFVTCRSQLWIWNKKIKNGNYFDFEPGPYFDVSNEILGLHAEILDTEYADSPRIEAFRQRLLREIDDQIWKKTLETELSLKVRSLADDTRVKLRDTSRKYV